jgi:hypothetical protein
MSASSPSAQTTPGTLEAHAPDIGRSPTPDATGMNHLSLSRMLLAADCSVGGHLVSPPFDSLSPPPPAIPAADSTSADAERATQDPSPPYSLHDHLPAVDGTHHLTELATIVPHRYPTPSTPGDQNRDENSDDIALEHSGLERPVPVVPENLQGHSNADAVSPRSAAARISPSPFVRNSLVHDIALHAHALFSSPRGTPQRIDMSRRLTTLLHRVGPQHLQPSAMVANVEYYLIFESDMFTICAFALRAGASMPIHDHPEMNVFRWVGSKALTGPTESNQGSPI